MGSSRGNSSAISVRVGRAALPMPRARSAGRAAHGHHQVPPLGGDGVGHQVADELDPHAARGLVAEGRRAARKRQVVVDGLRDVRHAQVARRPLRPAGTRERGVVPADRHQRVDPQLPQRPETGVQPPVRVPCAGVPHGRVGARGSENRSALEVDPRHIRDGQRPRFLDPALDEVLEPVHDPNDVPPGVPGLDRGRGDHRVHPRSRGAAAQDSRPASLHRSSNRTMSARPTGWLPCDLDWGKGTSPAGPKPLGWADGR